MDYQQLPHLWYRSTLHKVTMSERLLSSHGSLQMNQDQVKFDMACQKGNMNFLQKEHLKTIPCMTISLVTFMSALLMGLRYFQFKL